MASKFLYLTAPLLVGKYHLSHQNISNEMKEEASTPREAICIMNPEANQVARGIVHFVQASILAKTQINAEFTGLTPNNKHGFHIHQYGNLKNGCITAGPHYNPHAQVHGGPNSAVRHVGDLGNVQADENGNSTLTMEDSQVTLYGPFSVIGRACVLHRDTDDLGTADNEESKKTGNAGPRIACGVIGLAKE